MANKRSVLLPCCIYCQLSTFVQKFVESSSNTHAHTHTHTTILRSSWILSRTTQVSRHQKGKTNLDLLEQEIVSGSGISWAIWKSAPWHSHINHASISPLSFFYRSDALSAAQPTESKHWRLESSSKLFRNCVVWMFLLESSVLCMFVEKFVNSSIVCALVCTDSGAIGFTLSYFILMYGKSKFLLLFTAVM